MATNKIIKRFEELTKERDIYFYHDRADGYFIRVSDKGSHPKSFVLAELEPLHCDTMIEAMEQAVSYMEKDDEDFEKLIAEI